jgi:hypothetical protein
MPAPKTSITLSRIAQREIDARTEKHAGADGNRSATISRHLERYFSTLARARRELRQMFSDGEAMLIVDVLNGVAFWDTFGIYMVAHEVADGIALDGLDKKWGIDKQELMTKLARLNDAQALALVDSVTMWWDRVAQGEQPAHTAAVVFAEPVEKTELETE